MGTSSGDAAALQVQARPENLARIATFLGGVAEEWGLGSKETFDIQMAVDEACTNIIEHGYAGDEAGTIEIECCQSNDECTITIRDFGRSFEPDAVPEPDVEAPLEERPIGGLGLFFMRQLMDDVHFQFDEKEGNVLTMTKRRRPVVGWAPARAPDVHVVAPRGRLDADLAQQLQSELGELIAAGHHRLAIDLRGTTYVSSSGLRVLLVALRAARAQQGDVKLFGMKSPVRKVFTMSGFDLIFPIFPTEQLAIQAFRDPLPAQAGDSATS